MGELDGEWSEIALSLVNAGGARHASALLRARGPGGRWLWLAVTSRGRWAPYRHTERKTGRQLPPNRLRPHATEAIRARRAATKPHHARTRSFRQLIRHRPPPLCPLRSRVSTSPSSSSPRLSPHPGDRAHRRPVSGEPPPLSPVPFVSRGADVGLFRWGVGCGGGATVCSARLWR